LEAFTESAAELDELEALDCVIEQASESDDTHNKASCFCHVSL
jgi:hypothetical protein